MKHKFLIFICLALMVANNVCHASQQTDKTNVIDYTPKIHGTVRTKFEYQPEIEKERFEVRNARVSIDGAISRQISYKAEIDLSDEGQIKMLDAFARFKPTTAAALTLGQMRVPFTIDAHRSPHQQWFANRSFIAKQVGNVRDVGLAGRYDFNSLLLPLTIEAGIFNGSGLTNQKDYWTNNLNYSAKLQLHLPAKVNVVLSTQTIKPQDVRIYMWNAGANVEIGNLKFEGEYLFKHYKNDAFKNVNALNTMVCYDIMLPKIFHKISILGRYDMMTDHSNGKCNNEGKLIIDDAARKRVTGGVTLSLAKPFCADLRLNYENYFYKKEAVKKISEQSKIVVELMVRF